MTDGEESRLLAALWSGDLAAVKQNFSAYPLLVMRKEYPLYTAIRRGYLDIVRFLVENGADIRTESGYG